MDKYQVDLKKMTNRTRGTSKKNTGSTFWEAWARFSLAPVKLTSQNISSLIINLNIINVTFNPNPNPGLELGLERLLVTCSLSKLLSSA